MDNQPHGDHPRSEKKPDCGSRVGFSEQTSRGLGRAARENEKPKPGLPASQGELARSQPPLPVLGVRTPDADVPGVGLSAEPWLSNEGSAAFGS